MAPHSRATLKAAFWHGDIFGDDYLKLQFEVWFYVNPDLLPVHSRRLAEFITPRLRSETHWNVFSSLSLGAGRQEKLREQDEKIFYPLEIKFATRREPGDLWGGKADLERFEYIWEVCGKAVKEAQFKPKLGLDKDAVMVCYSLREAKDYEKSDCGNEDGDGGSKMSRWLLPVPQEPIKTAAERIELVLWKLVSMKRNQKDESHCHCTGYDVFECIENQLYKQRIEYELLNGVLDKLMDPKNDPVGAADYTEDLIDQAISAMESLDKTMSSIVTLFIQHVGRKAPVTGSNAFIRTIKKLFRKKLASIALDNQELEGLKEQAKAELASFHRIEPNLTAHVRMCADEGWKELARACSLAAAGTQEQLSMPKRMAIEPSRLASAPDRLAALRKVRRLYDASYQRVGDRVNALSKLAGGLYIDQNTSSFDPEFLKSKCGGLDKRYLHSVVGVYREPNWRKKKGCCMDEAERKVLEKTAELLED